MPFSNETIWIIGASSGIGRELAKSGAKLMLSARSADKLTALQQSLGAEHQAYPLDVSDRQQVQEVCAQLTKLPGGVDRIIFMSALYQPDPIANMDLEFMSKMVDVNLKGAFYLTHGVLPVFAQQQSGQMVLCGSVAGYTGLPNGQPYSATKAAIINFAESLYAEAPDYMDVKLINPGFVNTLMTAKNSFKMPMIITPEQAACLMIKGLRKTAFEIHFPKKFTLLLKLLASLPYRLKLFCIRRMPKNS